MCLKFQGPLTPLSMPPRWPSVRGPHLRTGWKLWDKAGHPGSPYNTPWRGCQNTPRHATTSSVCPSSAGSGRGPEVPLHRQPGFQGSGCGPGRRRFFEYLGRSPLGPPPSEPWSVVLDYLPCRHSRCFCPLRSLAWCREAESSPWGSNSGSLPRSSRVPQLNRYRESWRSPLGSGWRSAIRTLPQGQPHGNLPVSNHWPSPIMRSLSTPPMWLPAARPKDDPP